MAFDAGSAFVRLSGIFDDDGFKKWGKAQDTAEARSKNPVNAKLGANIDSKGFDQFAATMRRMGLMSATAQLKADSGQAERNVAKMGVLLAAYKRQVEERKSLNLDTGMAEAKIAALESRINETNRRGAIRKMDSDLRQLGVDADRTARIIGGGPGGAGGGGGVGGSNLLTSFGGLTGGVSTMLPMIGALSPALLGLGGALTAVAGSASEAALGAGVIGGGGLAALGTGLAGIMAVAAPAVSELQNVEKAQTAYNTAVSEYGKKSTEAQTAQKKLNGLMQDAGGPVKDIITGVSQLEKRWEDLTKPGRADFFHLIDDGIKTLNRDMPAFSRDADSAMRAVTNALEPVLKTIGSPEFRGIIHDLTMTFDAMAPDLINALSNFILGLGHIAADAGPQVEQFAQGLDHISTSFLGWTRNSTGVNSFIGTMVSQFKDWLGLLEATGKLLATVLGGGASQGQTLVADLTTLLNKWNDWLNTKQGQESMRKFFQDSVNLVKGLLQVIGPVADIILQLARTSMPLLTGLLTTIGSIVRVVAGMTNALPGFLKLLPTLALGAAVLGGWRLMRTYIMDIVNAARVGRELGGIQGALALAGGTAVGAVPAGRGRGVSPEARITGLGLLANSTQTAEQDKRLSEDIAKSIELSPIQASERATGAHELLGAYGGTGLGDRVIRGPGSLIPTGRTLLQRGTTAVGIGTTGLFAAQLAGSMIGGTAGRDVSTIGSYASAGAGLGSLLGPEGTIAGGVVGGLVGGFKSFFSHHSDVTYGKQLAAGIQQGMDSHGLAPPSMEDRARTSKAISTQGDIVDSLRKKIAQAHSDMAEITTLAPGTRLDPSWGRYIANLQREIQVDFDKIGRLAADQFNKSVQTGARYWDEHRLFGSMQKQLNALPPQARAAAANSMLQMTRSLVDQGRLPRDAVSKLIKDLDFNFDGMAGHLSVSGRNAMHELEVQFRMGNVLKAAQSQINDIGKTWADAPRLAKLNGANAKHNFQVEMDFLSGIIKTTTGKQREEARAAWQALAKDADRYSGLAADNAASHWHDMAQSVGHWMGEIQGVVHDGLGGQRGGILNMLDSALQGFGLHVPHIKISSPTQTLLSQGSSPFAPIGSIGMGANGPLATPKKEYGGYANASGSPRDDHILIDPRGQPVAAMSGTEGIFNGPHMQVIDAALGFAHAFGGLPYANKEDLWGSGMRHYAVGGLLSRADRLESMHLPYVWGGHHGDTGVIRDPRPGLDCSSAVSYVLGIPPRVSGAFENFGQPGPGPITIFANPTHVFMSIQGRGFGTSASNPRGGAGWLDYNSRPGFTVRHVGADFGGGSTSITAPHITGAAGALVQFGQSALNRGARGANQYLNSVMGSMDSAGGQPLNEGSVVPQAQVNQWLSTALRFTHHFSPSNLAGLAAMARGESSNNPTALQSIQDVNSRSNATKARGLLQTTPQTFAQYAAPGHRNIWNPVDNAIASINYQFARYGHIVGHAGYKMGGLLRRFVTGGSLARTARAPAAVHAPGRTQTLSKIPSLNVQDSNALTMQFLSGLGLTPQNVPGSLYIGLYPLAQSLIGAGAIPGLTTPDQTSNQITALGNQYTATQQLLTIEHGQLTGADYGTLAGIDMQEFSALGAEQQQLAGTFSQLATGYGQRTQRVAEIRHHARAVKARINQIQARLKRIQRSAQLRSHKRQEAMYRLADQIAKDQSKNADARNASTTAWAKSETTYKNAVAKLAPKHGDSKRVQASKRAALRKLQQQHRVTSAKHASRTSELHKQSSAISKRLAEARRKHGHQGFEDAWRVSQQKYKLQDRLVAAEKSLRRLVGSTSGDTDISKATGGRLAPLLRQEAEITSAAQTVVQTAQAIPSSQQQAALDIVSMAAQGGFPVPQSIIDFLGAAGLPISGLDALPAPGAGAAGGAVGGAADTGAVPAAPTAADIAAAASQQLQTFQQSQVDLLSQFGSNYIASPTMQSVLSGGAIGGSAFFGASGAAAGAQAGLEPGGGSGPINQFTQVNHYDTGPEDPHLHAQASKLEFSNAFG